MHQALDLLPRRHSVFDRRGFLVALAIALLLPGPRLRAEGFASEYQVKALFLLNFMRFVEWPPTAFADPAAPLVVGVLGENPFGSLLPAALKDERVRNRPVVIRELSPGDDFSGCHLLFLSRSERERLHPVLAALRTQSTLTVSEIDSFCQQGGMIRFVTRDGRVRFEINPTASAAAGLRLSAKLLQLATVVVHPISPPPTP